MVDLNEELSRLLNKAEWTDDEKRWLLQYLENTEGSELRDLMQHEFDRHTNNAYRVDPEITKIMLQKIREGTGTHEAANKASIFRAWVLKGAAAAVLGTLILGAYLWFIHPVKKQIAGTPARKKALYQHDIMPGGNKAVLTLGDGSTILLDEAQNGNLTLQGNTKVIKLDGKLAYNLSGGDKKEILYNTIATPRGGQYQVQLPDGSLVWLNAASSLRFPTSFAGKERRVEVSGEAYFEIAKNASMPFVVKVNSAEIKVTGTQFNIMAYDDEAVLKTTLLEGAVSFVTDDFQAVLNPGQQSQLNKNGRVRIVSNIDLNEVVAWKNGYFDFQGVDIVSITNQLSRWYEVEIIFEERIDDRFYAQIPRTTRLTDVLKALELTGKVHFKIEGRRILVSP